MTGMDDPRMPTTIERRVERLVGPLQKFVADQTLTSCLLLLSTMVALVLANSPWSAEYESVRNTTVGIQIGSWELSMSAQHWINDGLMPLFFFLLGLEIKRELLAGDLQDARRARLLIVTALGGMVLPALIYLAISPERATGGWGIPMATDTAFAIGVLALLKSRVPNGLAAFLVGLAILDDIGAVVVIALFYGEDLNVEPLLAAGGIFGSLLCLNLLGIRRTFAYVVFGAALWYAVYRSGVHTTVAGVLVALTVPARTKYSRIDFERRIQQLMRRFRRHREVQEDILAAPVQHEIVEDVRRTAGKAGTPLQRWETALETPIGLLILPLFALANAGVAIRASSPLAAASDPLVLAVAAGLVLGKFGGITAFCGLGLRLRVGSLPPGVTMRHVAGMSLLAGMGFTMSIFIADLAFGAAETRLETAKLGILIGTAVSGLGGYLALRFCCGSDPG